MSEKGLERDRTVVQISQNLGHEYWTIHLSVCLLAPLIHLLAPHCMLCSRTPLCLFICSLAHSVIPKLVEKWEF